MSISGQFFTIYIIHQAFFKNGTDLLAISRFLKVRYKLFASTNIYE